MKAIVAKEVGYAYPSSPNAERFGYTKTGCWTVDVLNAPYGVPKAMRGFAEKENALAWAEAMTTIPWSPTYARIHGLTV